MTVASIAAVRSVLAGMCRDLHERVPEGKLFDCKLVARELLVNAIRYGGGQADFSYACGSEGIEICVRSVQAFCPPKTIARAPADAERGRGLYLVDALCSRREYSEKDGIRVLVKI